MTGDGNDAPRPLRGFLQVLGFWAGFVAILEVPHLFLGWVPPPYAQWAWGTFVTAGALLLTLAFARVQRMQLSDLGIAPGRWSPAVLLAGLLGGFAIVVAQVAAVVLLLGLHVRLDPGASVGPAVLALATLLSLAAMEELGFRGYPLRRLIGPLGLWGSQAVVATAFGLYHHFAYGWGWVPSMIGTTLGSLLFGMAAVASRGLALPIGIHAGVNFGLWAFANTGGQGLFTLGDLTASLHGWRAQAPNAIYVITLLAATLLLWLWYRRSTPPTEGRRDASLSLPATICGTAGGP
jgi:membrane protease YdiL (CAAX protease family)